MKKNANVALQLHLEVTAKVRLDPIISTGIPDWGSILGREKTAFQIAGEICHPDLPEHFLRGGLKNLAKSRAPKGNRFEDHLNSDPMCPLRLASWRRVFQLPA